MSAPPTPPPDPGRPPPGRALLAVGVVVLALAGWLSLRTLQGLTNPIEVFNRVLLSPDEVFPETIYTDLVTGSADVRAFQFSAATFAFPDLVAYAGTRAVAGEGRRAILPWAAVFYLLLVGAAALGARAVLPPDRRPAATGLVLLAAAGYLGMNCLVKFEHRELAEFYLPLYHAGGAAAVFAGLVLVAGMCRRPGGWRSWRGPALLVLAAATTFSDRLFAVWLPGPLVAAAVGARMLRGRGRVPAVSPWPGLLVAVVALGIGCAAGATAVKWLPGPADPLQNYWTGAKFDAAAHRFGQLAGVVWDAVRGRPAHPGNPVLVATLGWLTLCAVTLAARGWAAVRRGSANPDSPVGNDTFVFLAAFSLVTTALNVAVFGISRTAESFDTFPPEAQWEENSRYFLVPQALGWFGWAAWAAHFAGGGYSRRVRLAAAGVPVALAAAVLIVAAVRVGPRVRDVLDYCPPDVERLDRVCAARGLTGGLADYGTAKRATVLSRTGVVVRQVSPRTGDRAFGEYHWLSNAQWYWRPAAGRPGPVRYEFVITYDARPHPWLMNTARVVAVLGEPAERVPLDGGAVLLVYNRPTDVVVRDFGATDPGVRDLRKRFDPGW